MKRLLIGLGILLVTILVLWVVYVQSTTKLTFERDSFSSIKVVGFRSIGLNTGDKMKAIKVIEYLESIRLRKNSVREVHNQSPEVTVFLNDKGGKIIERIDFYGDLVEYRGNQYRIIPFMFYNDFEKLCDKLKNNK